MFFKTIRPNSTKLHTKHLGVKEIIHLLKSTATHSENGRKLGIIFKDSTF